MLLEDLQVVLKVTECRSITAAAKQLDMHTATASAALKRVESAPAVKSCLDMSADLLSGKVVSVMPEFKPTSTELWLVCPSRQSITPAVRLLRDTFKEKSKRILNQLTEKGMLNDSAFI